MEKYAAEVVAQIRQLLEQPAKSPVVLKQHQNHSTSYKKVIRGGAAAEAGFGAGGGGAGALLIGGGARSHKNR